MAKENNAPMNWERESMILETAVECFGAQAQVIVAIEELSELIKALTKWLRHTSRAQGDEARILQSISEERADVSIMLSQLDLIFGDNSEMEITKLERLCRFLVEGPCNV